MNAAAELLASLSEEQRSKAIRRLEDESERRTWFYWPAPRAGLPLGDMTAEQRKLANHVVADVMSRTGLAKVQAIMALEHVLDEIEDRQGSRRGLPRDPALYYVTFFGEPSAAGPWSFRFEGHHVSLHVAVRGDDVSCTPCFLGANPAVVRHRERVVTRPLGEEEDAARDLLEAAGERAIVSPDAPDDILTVNAAKLDHLPGADGVRVGREAEELMAVYVERMRPDIASREMDRLRGEPMVFAWAGSTQRGERHYYRLTGRTFLAEYDNTQDDANHVHAVWRDLERDFGADVLWQHVARDH
jgi:hypothetical protein